MDKPKMDRSENFTLIGMPGVGKTTLGKVLAKKLGYTFVDIDVLIQTKTKSKLSDYIAEFGEVAFKKLEQDTILGMTLPGPSIISTGGSVVYSQTAMNHLKSLSTIIYLVDDVARIEKRVPNIATRGIVGLNNRSLLDLFNEREPLYKRYADVVFKLPKHFNKKLMIDTLLKHLTISKADL